MAAGAIPPPQFFERAIVRARPSEQDRLSRSVSGERHCQERPKTQFRRSCVWTACARRPSKRMIDEIVFSGVPDNAVLRKQTGSSDLARTVLLGQWRAQRTAAAGLRPPPLGVLIEAEPCSVNAFRAPEEPQRPAGKADKLLM